MGNEFLVDLRDSSMRQQVCHNYVCLLWRLLDLHFDRRTLPACLFCQAPLSAMVLQVHKREVKYKVSLLIRTNVRSKACLRALSMCVDAS